MGFVSRAANKAGNAAKDKAKAKAKGTGRKILHGRNHCEKSPSNVHQYKNQSYNVAPPGSKKKITITILECRYCGTPHKTHG